MYIPASNAEHRIEVLHGFMEAHSLGALVTASADGMFATHLPFILNRGKGTHGILEGHLARANPHHRHAHAGEALVIFTGPDAYITPSWYPSKAEHGKVVPTWNYVAVHVYGELRFTEDPAYLRRHLEELTARHETGREVPWTLDDAPTGYIDQLQRAIVGVELAITRIEGKWKMSQNRPAADVEGVIAGLGRSSHPTDQAVADLVAERYRERAGD